MARITGLNQCSPLPLFWAGSCVFFPEFEACSGFLAQIVVALHAKLLGSRTNGPACSLFAMRSVSVVWSLACTACNVNRCEK